MYETYSTEMHRLEGLVLLARAVLKCYSTCILSGEAWGNICLES